MFFISLIQIMKESIIYINYFDVIDQERVKHIMSISSQIIAEKKPDALYFLFSSPGGQVSAGIQLYNFLKALPTKIIMHNTGSIDSIATVVFLAGEERYAAHHSTFLFHGVSMAFTKDSQFNLTQLQELKSSLEEDQKKIAGIITSNTKLKSDDMDQLFLQGETKDLGFAKDKGVITAIKDPIIPKDELFITVNIQS